MFPPYGFTDSHTLTSWSTGSLHGRPWGWEYSRDLLCPFQELLNAGNHCLILLWVTFCLFVLGRVPHTSLFLLKPFSLSMLVELIPAAAVAVSYNSLFSSKMLHCTNTPLAQGLLLVVITRCLQLYSTCVGGSRRGKRGEHD